MANDIGTLPLTPGVASLSGSYPGTSPNFSTIQNLMAPPASGIAPAYQSAIDLINKQRDYYANLGTGVAQGLAARRGMAGSSIEQYGTQEAINQANLSATNSTASLLGSGANAQTQLTSNLGNLTSDEIASLRNMGLSQQQLALQQSLGQQGLNIAQQNIGAAQRVAQQQGTNSLINSGMNLMAP